MHKSDSEALPKYTYVPLDCDSFRLFRLVGGPDLREDPATAPHTEVHSNTAGPLRIECVNCHFENPISYDALSYCWAGHERSQSPEERGQCSQPSRHVLVRDGGEDGEDVGYILISASLETAMLHLRVHTDKPLFMDQLCINQADNAEKARLVRRMGDIYAKAERVLAWLGPSTLEAEKFLSFVEHQEEVAPPAFLRLVDHDSPDLDAIRLSVAAPSSAPRPVPDHLLRDRDMLKDMVIMVRDEIPLRGFVDVCSRQLFGRMWIVQEACLPGSLHFVCGYRIWAAVRLERALLFLTLVLAHMAGNLTHDDVVKDYPKVDDIIFAIGICRFVNRLFTTRRTIHAPDQTRMPLFHLLAKFNVADTTLAENYEMQKFRATDPRDCYYSLLALPEPHDTAVKTVVVDYNNSAQEVFIDLAKAIVVDYVDILLSSQNASKQLENLPSWVPDWSSQLATPYGYVRSNCPLFTAGCPRLTHHWRRASELHVDGSTLVVAGRLVDSVDEIGDCVYQTGGLEKGKPDEVSQHYFLSEIELFCRLARERQVRPFVSPPCEEDAPSLIASGGRGLTSNPEAEDDERLGPEIQGVRLLVAAYQISRQYLERHTRKYELLCWQNSASEVLSPLEEQWLQLKKRPALLRVLMYWLGIGTGWKAYEFCEKFNQHWVEHGTATSAGPSGRPDGWDLEEELRDEAVKVSGLLGRAMDAQQGRRCYVTPKGFVGLGQLEVQAGDLVAILQGASVPVMLRSCNPDPEGRQVFKYVGEAYCYGIMGGELLHRQANEEELSFRII